MGRLRTWQPLLHFLASDLAGRHVDFHMGARLTKFLSQCTQHASTVCMRAVHTYLQTVGGVRTRMLQGSSTHVFWAKETPFFQCFSSVVRQRAQRRLMHAHSLELQWYRHTYRWAVNEIVSFLLGRHWQHVSNLFHACHQQWANFCLKSNRQWTVRFSYFPAQSSTHAIFPNFNGLMNWDALAWQFPLRYHVPEYSVSQVYLQPLLGTRAIGWHYCDLQHWGRKQATYPRAYLLLSIGLIFTKKALPGIRFSSCYLRVMPASTLLCGTMGHL